MREILPNMRVPDDIRYAVSTIRRTDVQHILCESQECTDRYVAQRKKFLAVWKTGIQKYAPAVSLAGEHQLYEKIRQNLTSYVN